MRNYKIIITALVFILFIGCSKDQTEPQEVAVQDFVWKGLNAYYLWQSSVPDLSDRRFNNRNELTAYLQGYEDPASFFNTLLYKKNEVDKFSWIVDDYIALEKYFQGIYLQNGMEFNLMQYEDGSENIYGYVKYVIDGSSAASKGIKRGMLFNQVNGTQLTSSNYRTLLTNNSYTITLANFNAGNPIASTNTFTLTKAEIQENPILVSKIVNSGSKKVGYILYNQFVKEYDANLNTEFAKFKSEGVDEFIVDLRYNGGGSVRTATYLASMITGQFKGQLFAKQLWNEKYMNVHGNKPRLRNNFTDKIDNGLVNQPINSLNLPTVYFIVTDESASASELIINGLKPYINVKLVGTKTYGKHVGSITLYDADNYRKEGPNFNTSHTWAMQPIVLEMKNKNNENAPEGFTPDIVLQENPDNLGILGDINEPLLKRTLQFIETGAKPSGTSISVFKKISDSNKIDNQNYGVMHVELK